MKILSPILFSLLLIACPAGAATIALSDIATAQQDNVIVPPMTATELFTLPVVERTQNPDQPMWAQRLNENRLSPP